MKVMMKKSTKFLTAVSTFFMLVACGGGGSSTSEITNNDNERIASGLIRSLPVGGNTNSFASFLQADGKIIVGGRSSGNCVVVRFNSRKNLDTTLNKTGILYTTKNETDCEIKSLVTQSDGKILALSTKNFAAYLQRFNIDGSLDESFAQKGEYKTSYTSVDKVFLEKDGKITIATFVGDQLGLTRLTSSGELDRSFGANGIGIAEKIPVGSRAGYVSPRKIVRTIDEDFLIAFPSDAFYVQKILKNGTLDRSFGNYVAPYGGLPTMFWAQFEGQVGVGGGRVSFLTDIVPLSNGSFYAVGFSSFDTFQKKYELGIAKGTLQGKTDLSLNANGKLLTGLPGSVSFAQVQKNEKLVMTGFESNSPAVYRLNSNGSIDATFKNGRIADFLSAQSVVDIHIQTDGKIILVFQDFSFIRLLEDGSVE